jgi:hypothetical protein
MSYPRPDWTRAITATLDISGTPTLLVNPANDGVFYAVTARGTVGSVGDTGTYSVVVGALDSTGAPLWYFRDPSLVTASSDTQPQLALGLSGELYLSFVTQGSIPGFRNAADVPSLCGSCGSTSGRDDIVLARINGATTGAPTVAWRVQDAYLNSCNNENAVRLHYDNATGRIFLAYQCSGATLCNVAIGTANILVVCYHPDGYLTWSYQGDLMNGVGNNRKPSIATDASGNVFVTYTVTAAVAGGGTLRGTQDVEVIRLHVEGTPLRVERDWILSASTVVNAAAGATNTDPAIAVDSSRSALYLAFSTTGTVPGGTKTATISDIVFASIDTRTGALNWLEQKADYNEVSYRFNSVDSIVATLNQYGALFIAAHAVDSAGRDMIVMYRLDPPTGDSSWYFRVTIAEVYRAYVPASAFTPPFTAVTATAVFSPPTISVWAGHLYVGFSQYNIQTLYIVGLNEVDNFLEFTAQQYIRAFTSICSVSRKT